MSRTLRLSYRIYDTLLTLYPAAHREAYGDLMRQCFRDMAEDAWKRGGSLAVGQLWPRIALDTLNNALIEHYDHRKGQSMHTIGRYEIKKRLGEGSASHVYLAYDPASGRDVALKVRLDTGVPESALSLFENEVRIMTTLKHPAVPAVYDYALNGGDHYLAMEYIEGQSLLEAVGERVDFVPEQDLAAWGVNLCDFLVYLHGERITFGDMKPGNVLIDADGAVRVIDFGIVQQLPPGETQVKALAIGTAGYSPPEQYAGIRSAAGDIYALGATLYHAATRRDPREPHGQFLFHVMFPRLLNPELSQAFEAVILKATEHKAADRFQSAADMKAALEQIIQA